MGSLAGLLQESGHEVRGSDEHVYPPMSTQLEAQHIAVVEGFAAANLDWQPDVVVVGNACRKDHVEVLAAQERGLKLASFPSVLEDEYLRARHALVVAGTHGKTTTSSLAAFVLLDAGRDPGFLIGGVPRGAHISRGFHAGAKDAPFVVEGDEYDTAFFDKGSKFFHYHPRTAILTSVELDHVDIFSSLEAVKDAFRKFVALIPEEGLLVACADDIGAMEIAEGARCRVERYHVASATGAANVKEVDWIARPGMTRPGGRTPFVVERRGEHYGDFETGLPGRYNLANALAVIAACAGLGLTADEIARGVRRFTGVRRRQEIRGVAQGVTVVDDFAHHPTAVRETLAGLHGRFGGGKLFALFEPRSATSRRAVFQHEYVDAFRDVDEVIIASVHLPEKAPEGDRFDCERLASDLRREGVHAKHIAGVDAIARYVAERAAPGDTVVAMSSGSFGGVHEKILSALGVAVTEARASDLPRVHQILERTALPYPDLDNHLDDLMAMRDAGEVIGCVAVELYDEAALLRSLAIIPERRGEGLGWMLADVALNRARERGVRRVFLTTEHATDFFAEKFGFHPVDRATVDQTVLASSQFKTARASGAITMRLDL